MRRIAAVAFKDLTLLLRDRLAFFFVLVWPLLLGILFGSMYGGGSRQQRSIPIVIVDEDNTIASKAFADSLSKSAELNVSIASRDSAIQLVRQAKAVAYVAMEKGFGEASAHSYFGNPPSIEIGLDPSRKLEAGMLEGIMMNLAGRQIAESFRDPKSQITKIAKARTALNASQGVPDEAKASLNRLFDEVEKLAIISSRQSSDSTSTNSRFRGFVPLTVTRIDVSIKSRWPQSAYAITFPQAAVWALVSICASFTILLVLERTEGTLARLLASPLSSTELLLGKVLACFISSMAMTTLLFVIGYTGFKVVPNSVPLLALAILSSTVAFAGLMMLLAASTKSERAVGGLTWGVLIVLTMFGGGMIPLFVMPTWMTNLGSISPVKWAILAIEGAVWRQFTSTQILRPCLILIAMGVGCSLLGRTRRII